jgi:hypothetical protein
MPNRRAVLRLRVPASAPVLLVARRICLAFFFLDNRLCLLAGFPCWLLHSWAVWAGSLPCLLVFFSFFFRKSNVFFSSIKGLPPPAWKRSFWRCSEFRKSSHSSPPNFGRFCPGLSLPFVGSVAIKPSNSPPPCKFVAGAKIEVVENRTHTRRGENQSDEEMMMK